MRTRTEAIAERKIYVESYDISYVLLRTYSEGRTYFSVTATLFGADTGNVESMTVRDITGDPNEAARMFRLICDGAVTPMTLEDVIYDLIS